MLLCFVFSLRFLLSEIPLSICYVNICVFHRLSPPIQRTSESSELVCLFILCSQGLSHHRCEYRQTSEVLLQFQTTAVKRVIIFLLVVGPAFNL